MSPHTTAAPEITTVLAIVKTLILLVGGLITYLSFKAFRRTRQRSLGALALGFGIVTLGSLLAGIANDVVGTSLAAGVLIESFLVLVGFGVIAYSLYMQS